MSPASQAKRKKLAQYERTNSFRKLARYEENEVTLDDEQNDEMNSVVEKIGDEEVQRLCDKLRRKVWHWQHNERYVDY